MEQPGKMFKKMVGKIIATVLIGSIALIGSLLFVAFYANGFSIFQKIIVVIAVLIAACALISILWILWWAPYMKQMKSWRAKDWEQWK